MGYAPPSFAELQYLKEINGERVREQARQGVKRLADLQSLAWRSVDLGLLVCREEKEAREMGLIDLGGEA